MKKTAREYALQFGIITLSCGLYALGFNWFFAPNHLSVGGFTGLAQIVNYFIPGASIGMVVVLLNIPLFILSYRRVGRIWLVATLYATFLSSAMIDLMAAVYTFPPTEPMLAAVFGGATVGLGCGLLMRESATTGGSELAARLLKLHFPGLSIGTLCLFVDGFVIVSYAAVFRDMTQSLYAALALFIITKTTDWVVYGDNGGKVAYIISAQYEAITRELLKLDRGVTLLSGRGGFSGEPKNVILCAFSKAQIVAIKAIVKEADANAFMIVCDAHDVVGEGFGVNTPDGL